jgi:2-polyprenyl-3-methyl-5-hydroxy-6-metoxy-1,4-benzoquinol methylase
MIYASYEKMYSQQWVQDQIHKIQTYIRDNRSWVGMDDSSSQRVLDYACGNGTISLVSHALRHFSSCHVG